MNVRLPILGFFREHQDTEVFKFKTDFYKQAYHELLAELTKSGVYVAILMGQGTYLGNGKFSKHWVQVEKAGQLVFEKRGEIKVDVVWVKDKFIANDVAQINSAQFRQVCSDKNLTYELLSRFQPQSCLVQTEAELNLALAKIPGEMIAIKTPFGNSGLGVFVGKKSDFNLKEFAKDFPLQVQEYIETKAGIPGIVAGRHDFRVVLMNGEAVIATLRTPPEGGFKSNIGYGGFTRLLTVDEIPDELMVLCREIDQELAKISQQRFYSADFGLTAQGWRLFEVNAMPGTLNRDRGAAALDYQLKLAKFLANSARLAMKGGLK